MDAPIELSCRQFVELVTDLLDGALDAGTQTAIAVHLVLCAGCAVYLEQIRFTVRALRLLADGKPL